MAHVSVGQVENLAELISGLSSVYEALESLCREQIAVVEAVAMEVRQEVQTSGAMLTEAQTQEMAAQNAVAVAESVLASAESELMSAKSMFSA